MAVSDDYDFVRFSYWNWSGSMFWLGLFVGANIGLIIASLLRAGKDDTDA
jgi:hypothetical protein